MFELQYIFVIDILTTLRLHLRTLVFLPVDFVLIQAMCRGNQFGEKMSWGKFVQGKNSFTDAIGQENAQMCGPNIFTSVLIFSRIRQVPTVSLQHKISTFHKIYQRSMLFILRWYSSFGVFLAIFQPISIYI